MAARVQARPRGSTSAIRKAGEGSTAAQAIRLALTGSTRSPDLYSVARVLGADEVRQRVAALTASPP